MQNISCTCLHVLENVLVIKPALDEKKNEERKQISHNNPTIIHKRQIKSTLSKANKIIMPFVRENGTYDSTKTLFAINFILSTSLFFFCSILSSNVWGCDVIKSFANKVFQRDADPLIIRSWLTDCSSS